jgi:hypothetical protein
MVAFVGGVGTCRSLDSCHLMVYRERGARTSDCLFESTVMVRANNGDGVKN